MQKLKLRTTTIGSALKMAEKCGSWTMIATFSRQLMDYTLKQNLVCHLGILPSTIRVSEGKTNTFPTVWPRKISRKLLSTMTYSSTSRLRHCQSCGLFSCNTMQRPPSQSNPLLALQCRDIEHKSSTKQPPIDTSVRGSTGHSPAPCAAALHT